MQCSWGFQIVRSSFCLGFFGLRSWKARLSKGWLCNPTVTASSVSLMTFGTKMIAESGKYIQKSVSEFLLSLLGDRPCLALIIVSSIFRFCSSCRTNHWNLSESYYFHQERLKIIGPAPFENCFSNSFSADSSCSSLLLVGFGG